MARGNTENSKVFYKGQYDDFIIFVDDLQAVKNWKKDKSIPLAQVVSGWRVFVTHRFVFPSQSRSRSSRIIDKNEWFVVSITYTCYRQGAQGILDTASKSMLTNEFGTSNDEEVVKQILEKGEAQESEVRFYQPSRLKSIADVTWHTECGTTWYQERVDGSTSGSFLGVCWYCAFVRCWDGNKRLFPFFLFRALPGWTYWYGMDDDDDDAGTISVWY